MSCQIPPPQAQDQWRRPAWGPAWPRRRAERGGGGAHGRALAEHDVGVARRTDQLDAEPLDIIIGRQDIEHFNVAAVAPAAVGVIDPRATGRTSFWQEVLEHSWSVQFDVDVVHHRRRPQEMRFERKIQRSFCRSSKR